MMSILLSDRLQSASEEKIVHSEDLSPGRDCDERETISLSNGIVRCNQNEGNDTRTSETLISCSISGVVDSFQLKQTSSSNLRHDQTIVGFHQKEIPTVTTGETIHTNENQPADVVNEHLKSAEIIDVDVLGINSKAREKPSHRGDNLTDILVTCRIEGDAVSDDDRSENRQKKTESGSLLDPATKIEASAGTESKRKEGAAAGEDDSQRRTFDQSAIENVTKEMLRRNLCDIRYEPTSCKVIGHQLAGEILKRIIRFCPKRYKLVIFVSIGSLCDRPGIQFGSRCLWDADTDILATARYANDTLFAVAMVYALCTD